MNVRAPLWTLVIAGLFGVMGVGVSFAVWSDPTVLFPTATLDNPMLASWAVRNLATALVLLVTAATRRADALMVGFLGRAFTEIGDAALAAPTGDVAGIAVPAVMLGVDVVAGWTLWRASARS
jgi:hypothetical protein